eukprot:11229770-Alexandrium_andersonii.AAC.1
MRLARCSGVSGPESPPTRRWASRSAAVAETSGAVTCWDHPWAPQVAHGAAYHSPAAVTAASPSPASGSSAAAALTNSG